MQLSASDSSDPDGDRLSYSWRQTDGPAVALSDASARTPVFTAPLVGSTEIELAFEMTVTDGKASTPASVVVRVYPLNFLVIITDDQTVASAASMPTLQQRVVAEGTSFDNSFVTTSLCCPSRSSFLTGLYTHNHGVLKNFAPLGGATRFDDTQTIGVWLNDAGYHTGFFGKYLNDYSALLPHVPPGWDRWVAFTSEEELAWQYDYDLNEDGVIRHYGHDSEDYSTDVLADKVLEFLDESGRDPFLVWFTPRAPHLDFVPAERHLGLLENEQLRHPPNYYEADVSDKPSWIQNLSPEPAAWLDESYPRYLETLLAVDDALAAFIDKLEELGVLDRTVIIFTSDNSISWGEHRWTQKRSAYEEDVRVPLVIRFPASTAPTRTESVALNIDLAPTLAELAGVQPGIPVDGVSHAEGLRSGAWSAAERSEFLIENFGNEGDIPPEFFGVRTLEWKYVEYRNGERELYDLVNDPFELDNVVDVHANADVAAELEADLQELRASGTGNEALRVTTPASIALTENQDAYVVTMTASGGVAPHHWAPAYRVPLPAGATLDSEGVLTVPASAFLDDSGAPTRVLTIGAYVEDQTDGWDCARIALSLAE